MIDTVNANFSVVIKNEDFHDLRWQENIKSGQNQGTNPDLDKGCSDQTLILNIGPISAKKRVSEYIKLHLKSLI